MAADGTPAAGRRKPRETPGEARARRATIEDPETVLAAAARLLESRQRTVHEIRDHLARAGYRPDLAEAAVARLVVLGYLDDEAFARAWVASRDRAHPRGERALRMEMGRKGVPRDVVDAVLAERSDAGTTAAREGKASASRSDRTGDDGSGTTPSADEAAAARLLERRRSSLERIQDPGERRRRAYALLARAGFDPETAATAAGRFAAPAD